MYGRVTHRNRGPGRRQTQGLWVYTWATEFVKISKEVMSMAENDPELLNILFA